MAEVEENTVSVEDKTAEVDSVVATVKTEDAKADLEEQIGSDTVVISKLESEIIRQIEYYFGDYNLSRDKFLIEQISKDEGWVSFPVLLSFKRLASLTTEPEEIVKALRKSEDLLIEISEDKQKIRRHPDRPLPELNEERRKEIMSRTAYAKGFPLNTEMSQLIDFFAPFEKVVNIIMRKYLHTVSKTYKFKGSVFVTFDKKEQCEAFLNKEKVLYEDVELLRKWQEQYLDDKREERAALLAKKKQKSKEKKEEKKLELPKGTVLHFEGAIDPTSREDIREAVSKLSDNEVAFIGFNKGDKEGYVRFVDENTAKPFFEKLEDKKLKVGDSNELTLRLLSEEEEKEFLIKAVDHMKSRRIIHNQNKHHQYRGGNRKRRNSGTADRKDDGPRSKRSEKFPADE